MTAAALVLAVAAGLHVAAIGDHAAGSGAGEAVGAFFVTAVVVQFVGAMALLQSGASGGVRWFVVGSNLVLIAVWALSRTVGLPVGSHPGVAESIGVLDGLAVVAELSVVLVVSLGLGLERGRGRGRGRGHGPSRRPPARTPVFLAALVAAVVVASVGGSMLPSGHAEPHDHTDATLAHH